MRSWRKFPPPSPVSLPAAPSGVLLMGRFSRRGNADNGHDHVAALWGLGETEPTWLSELDGRVHDLLAQDEVDDELAEALLSASRLIGGNGNGAPSEVTAVAIGSAAATGYLARRAEREKLDAADQGPARLDEFLEVAAPWSGNGDGEITSTAEQAARLAAGESIDPGPDDRFAPTAALPGLAVKERRTLREKTLRLVVRSRLDGTLMTPEGEVADAGLDDFRRAWKYGHFLRGLEEASAARRALTSR